MHVCRILHAILNARYTGTAAAVHCKKTTRSAVNPVSSSPKDIGKKLLIVSVEIYKPADCIRAIGSCVGCRLPGRQATHHNGFSSNEDSVKRGLHRSMITDLHVPRLDSFCCEPRQRN